jgi:hypothetical protein
MRSTIAAAAVLAMLVPALAQNTFPTAGGAVVTGRVMLQANAVTRQAESCPGPTGARPNYPTPGGSIANSRVSMCLNASNQAVPCATTC